MSRRSVRALIAAVAVVAVVTGAGAYPGTGLASAQEPPPPLPPPLASIVVNADTGEVITASNDRQPLPPASTTKILTALLVYEHLALDADITVSKTASIAPPRRLRLPAGTRWRVNDLLYAMMHCSCNDAAWALGQAAGGGSMAGFSSSSGALAASLGMTDGPVIRDPAGLDDERSIRGGNVLSARDLAIAARAFLAIPELAEVAASPGHEWVGGDGKPHSVTNQNRFLDQYAGAIGVKTGATSKAGRTFVGAARRGGRTLIAVILNSQDHYASARFLLDQGFMLAAVGQRTGDTLPSSADPSPPPTSAPPTSAPPTTDTRSTTSTPRDATVPESNGHSSTSPDGDGEEDEEGPATEVAMVGAGAGVVVAGGGAVLLVRRHRRNRRRIDRRPARPRRRDRRRPRPR